MAMNGTQMRAALAAQPEEEVDEAENSEEEGAEDASLTPEMLELYAAVMEKIEHSADDIEDACMSLEPGVLTADGELDDEAKEALTMVMGQIGDDDLVTMLREHLAGAPPEDVALIAKHCVGEGYFDELTADELAGFLVHGSALAMDTSA